MAAAAILETARGSEDVKLTNMLGRSGPNEQEQKSAFAEWVKVNRRRRTKSYPRGMSQTELARLAQVTTSYVSDWEVKGRIPSRKVITRLAELFTPMKAGKETAARILAEGLAAAGYLPDESVLMAKDGGLRLAEQLVDAGYSGLSAEDQRLVIAMVERLSGHDDPVDGSD